VAASTKQAETNANHAARLLNAEKHVEIQNGKIDALTEAMSGVRVDLAKLPGEIQGRVNGTLTKVAIAVFVGLLLNAAAWMFTL